MVTQPGKAPVKAFSVASQLRFGLSPTRFIMLGEARSPKRSRVHRDRESSHGVAGLALPRLSRVRTALLEATADGPRATAGVGGRRGRSARVLGWARAGTPGLVVDRRVAVRCTLHPPRRGRLGARLGDQVKVKIRSGGVGRVVLLELVADTLNLAVLTTSTQPVPCACDRRMPAWSEETPTPGATDEMILEVTPG